MGRCWYRGRYRFSGFHSLTTFHSMFRCEICGRWLGRCWGRGRYRISGFHYLTIHSMFRYEIVQNAIGMRDRGNSRGRRRSCGQGWGCSRRQGWNQGRGKRRVSEFVRTSARGRQHFLLLIITKPFQSVSF